MLGVSYPGPPDLPFPSGYGESSRYTSVLTVSADDGVESAYMRENCKHGYSFLWSGTVFSHVRDLPTADAQEHLQSRSQNVCNQLVIVSYLFFTVLSRVQH